MPQYADAALVAQLSQPNKYHAQEDASLAALYAHAEDIEVLTNNVTENGAAAVAGRLKPMGQPGMGGWALIIPEILYSLTIGDTIEVAAPGVWVGKRNFYVRGESIDESRDETVLDLIGGSA